MDNPRLTFREIKTACALVPLKRPLATKVGNFVQLPLVLIDLLTEEGITGRSYLLAGLKQAAAYIVSIMVDLSEANSGLPLAPVEMHARNSKSMGPMIGYQGLTTMAIAGLDMAAWDAKAKAAGLPLGEYLGGTLAPVEAYNSNGLGLMSPEAAAIEVVELLADGNFQAVKQRVGRDTLKQDLQAVERVRKEVGEEVLFFFDFNQGLSRDEAMKRCLALDDFGGVWIEEPIPYDDFEGCAQLAAACNTSIMLGENFYGPSAMHEALRMKACDLVMPDLMRIGGITGWLRAAAIAQAWGVRMSSHLYPEISSHLMRVTPTAHWLEWVDWAEPILAEPFEVKEGKVHIPNKPGNGLSWEQESVKRYRFQ